MNGMNAAALATLIRRAADSELTPEQARALEAISADRPDIANRIEFERALRKSVHRSMAATTAPPQLRDRVQELFAAGSSSEAATAPIAQTVFTSATRSRSFWSGARRSILAAAAVVVIAITASLAVRSLHQSSLTPAGWSAPALIQSVSFMENEHRRCNQDEVFFNRKMQRLGLTDATRYAADHLGVTPTRLDLSGIGFKLAGLGHCSVPADGASVHVLYRSTVDSMPDVSVFIVKDTQAVNYDPETCYCVPGALSSANPVFIWREGGLIYYIVCPDGEQPDQIRTLLGAPAKEIRI